MIAVHKRKFRSFDHFGIDLATVSAKKPRISAKEPDMSAKEPGISTKEPYLSTNEIAEHERRFRPLDNFKIDLATVTALFAVLARVRLDRCVAVCRCSVSLQCVVAVSCNVML